MALPHRFSPAARVLLPSVLLSAALGCSGKPAEEEKPPPHVVEWKGPADVILRDWTELLGTVQPLPENGVRVSAPVEGQVISVLPAGADGKTLKEGDTVKAGTLLVQLNARIAQANADKVKALKDALDQELQQARSAVPLAQKKYDNLKDLPTVPELQKEEARVGVEDAKSKVIAAKKRLEAAEKEAQAAAEQVQLYSLKTALKGRLDRILVSPGQTIPVGTVVAEVADIDKEVDVLCFVPLSIARRLAQAEPQPDGFVEARIGGVEQTNVSTQPVGPKGRIAFIADRADPDTGNFAVKVRFPNAAPAGEKLRPNTALRIRVLLRKQTALSIPESALLEDTDPPNVIVVDEEIKKDKTGKEETVFTARRLQATIGMRDRMLGMVEIKDLKDPDNKWKGDLKEARFVTTKNQGLQTGDALKQEEDEPEAAP